MNERPSLATGRRLTSGVVITLIVVIMVLACTAAPDGNPEASSEPSPTLGEIEGNRPVVSHLDNLLVRVERGDWTPDEGLALALRLLVGGAPPSQVVGRQVIASRDLTGIVATGTERVAGMASIPQRRDVEKVLEFMVFSQEQLGGMAIGPQDPSPTRPPRPEPTGPLPTAGATDVPFVSQRRLPTAETDCQRFFRRFYVGDLERCLVVREALSGGVDYLVYAPAPSLASFRWEQHHYDLIDQAVAESVAVFGDLGTLPRLTFMLGIALAVHADAMTVADGQDCRIMLYTGAQGRSDVQFKQVVAQQLAHCLQAAMYPEQHAVPYAVRAWREDGLATYLSSLVYPTGDLELESLSPLVSSDGPTTLFDWSSAAASWWQYVGEESGWQAIDAIVRALPSDGDAAAQAAALAATTNAADLFSGFVEAFVDGEIGDGAGGTLPTRWIPSVEQEAALVEATGTVVEEPMEPFSFLRHLLVVPGNLRASLDATSTPAMTVRSRALADTDWANLPDQFPPDCASDLRLAVVLTSAASVTTDARVSISALEPSGC